MRHRLPSMFLLLAILDFAALHTATALSRVNRVDFDGDGRSDVLGIGIVDPYGRYTASGGLFFRSGGAALPTETVWARNASDWNGYVFQIGDFDGDGKSDILGIGVVDEYRRYTGSGCLFIRWGGGLRNESVWACSVTAWTNYTFQVGDFDGDGKSDVLGLGSVDTFGRYTGSGGLFIRYGGVSLPSTAVWARDVSAWNGYTFQVGDFDGDGKDDVLGIGFVGQSGRYLGSGGLFVRSGGVNLPVETVWARDISAWKGYIFQAGDFDGDGKADVLGIGIVDAHGRYSGAGGLFVRSGGLNLPSEAVWARDVGAWREYVFRVGDFDGDGRSDVAGIGGVDPFGRYLGAGGLFVRSGGINLPVETVWARDVSAWRGYVFDVGDYDGDNKSDILGVGFVDTRGHYHGEGGLFVRHGGVNLPVETVWARDVMPWINYRFTLAPEFLDFRGIDLVDNQGRDLAYTPAVIDLNDDGWLELLGAYNNTLGSLYTLPSASFGLSALFQVGRSNRDTRLADFNGDGLLDVISNTYSCAENAASKARLYFNRGDGTFVEDPDFMALDLRGHGETIVTADFNNDGALDLFLPYYTFLYPPGDPSGCTKNAPQSYLLLNNGRGKFADIAALAGVRLSGVPPGLRPEGAQAADFNFDGFIDFYVASHLFINNGNFTFRDSRAHYLLPERFDEGAKFIDWNNDGRLDLVLMDPREGPQLYEFGGSVFTHKTLTDAGKPFFSSGPPGYAPPSYDDGYGINAYDINNDGREDILTMGGATFKNEVFLNTGKGFEKTRVNVFENLGNGQSGMTFGDVNRDGQVDVLYPTSGMTCFINRLPPMGSSFSIEVLGPNGERNQQGRVMQITPMAAPNVIFTRVVDGGSGYMAQSQYPVLVGTPYSGNHRVRVFFAPRNGSPVIVSFVVAPGQRVRVFAPSASSTNGSIQILNALPPAL